MAYEPVQKHWFYNINENIWLPFSVKESNSIQKSYEGNGPNLIPTNSGRYDVNIKEKTHTPVYWPGDKYNNIRLSSWFYRTLSKNYIPYDVEFADLLEATYKNSIIKNTWNVQLKISDEEFIFFQSPNVILHFLNYQDISNFFWSEILPTRIVKRGLDNFTINPGDDDNIPIDHLVFVVHGIASGVILKGRTDIEACNQLRDLSSKLIHSHYQKQFEEGLVGRIEILPSISWQELIHSPENKLDEKLKTITLLSIPKFRNITNNSILDVLSYTSPFHSQNILNMTGNSINENYQLFCQRNPNFNGKVSLVGHSLGGLIIFDLLCNQGNNDHSSNLQNQIFIPLGLENSSSSSSGSKKRMSGTGQTINGCPQLVFEPDIFFALGSPIGLFVALRDSDCLGINFKLPTCNNFFNIFHPYDPVAYRMEGLILPELGTIRPVEIPYHKGGKRKHLEIKKTMIRYKNEIKEKVFVAYKNIFDKLSLSSKNSKVDEPNKMDETNQIHEINEIEEINEINEIINELHETIPKQMNDKNSNNLFNTDNISSENESYQQSPISIVDLGFGKLNNSQRIDYVLQARPHEAINEYLFAINSHICYWESKDTVLFMLNKIYSPLGITYNVNVNN